MRNVIYSDVPAQGDLQTDDMPSTGSGDEGNAAPVTPTLA